ncbi:MAG TPA: hypothetical protein VL635_20765 [Trinickia sp.]|nr:hypothetical protein [Trinickia sp.]
MTMAAVVPAIYAAGALASSIASALSDSSGAASGGLSNGSGLNPMERALKRQEAMQLQTMEMQTEASIRKMLADTANSIASGHLDSGAKVQNASIKAAQSIHF